MARRGAIFVIGTGRSGTSTIAKLLHKKLHVCMGHQFREANEFNPDGFYEDIKRSKLLDDFIRGRINLDDWLNGLPHKCGSTLWGFKHPRLLELSTDAILAAEPSLIVRTYRPERLVVPSLVRSVEQFKGDEKKARITFRWREDKIGELQKKRGDRIVRIDFSEKRDSEDLICELQEALAI